MATKKIIKNKDTKQDNKKEIYQFKIALKYSDPLIWRRIQVPVDYTFWAFHCAIQDAMGWDGGHLHGFRFINKKNNYRSINIGLPLPDDDVEYLDRLIDERTAMIADYFGKISKQCVYEYDFGDGWEHAILLEKIILAGPKEKYPKIIAGANACPPEDCGGIGGYYNLLKILKDPKNPEYEEIREWLGLENSDDNFDPNIFNPDEIVFSDSAEELKFIENMGNENL